MLSPPADPSTSASTHMVHDFVTFFGRKVEGIRTATSTATSPDIPVRPTNSFSHISPVSCSEVIKVLASMPAKSCFLDPVPTWIVKKMQDVLAPVICNLCNATLRCAIFPASQKQAIVSPRLKKSTLDPDHLTSYRPISNLSFTSKVVERIVASRFVRHAEDNHLFPTKQSSYRRGHSTETAMLCVYNDLVRAVDSKLVTALVLLDLSSAFDTVDHSTLLTVLDRRFGVRESAMDWFSSYLSDRTQTFCANGVMSGSIPVTCSVPQGSVLGPVLFISYTEDVSVIFDSHQVNHHLYADDKQAYVSVPANNVSLARHTLESCISDITSWCSSRRLQLNAAKTELIWFGSRQMLEKLTDTDLTLDTGTTVIRPLKSVRDLGVHLDSELTMKTHISKVVSCCYHQLRRIRQVRRLVGQDVAQQLVSAFILSRLDYCNSLLSRLPRSTIQPLQRVMNAAARVTMNLLHA